MIYVALKEGIQIYDLVKNEKTPWKVISLPNIRDLEIYFSVFNEFTVNDAIIQPFGQRTRHEVTNRGQMSYSTVIF